MTVEQPSLPQPNQGVDRNVVKIEEFTGINDHVRITNAIAQCSNDAGVYELDEVINVLLADTSGVPARPRPARSGPAQYTRQTAPPAPAMPPATPAAPPVPVTKSKQRQNNPKGLIDLTNETSENEELQKAIAASLQDSAPGILGGQISREELEISRALEANMAENKAGTKQKRGNMCFIDVPNPHERRRRAIWPVGLKNVGNTCWFSAVIQSLYHLPVFRRLVLNFDCPAELRQGNAAETRNMRFMHELRHLFALAHITRRKYIDPSKAVDILKEAFTLTAPSGAADSQQDVSEFQHKLLEWLEDTFSRVEQHKGSGDHEEKADGEKHNSNPMKQLFYGQFVAEGVNEGKSFTNKETFGQFPLQVNGFRDIYESLDAAMAHGEIETVNNDATAKSRQEQWFTRLPPVLTFELSRFQFNQNLGRPEKIHNKLSFPKLMYMDRYMLGNKVETRQKREELKRLKVELTSLQEKLDKFINYGTSAKRFPLMDILKSALEFAERKPLTSAAEPSDDLEMDSPKSSIRQTESRDRGGDQTGKQQTDEVDNQQPAPRSVTQEELGVLQNCLKRWRTEVESDVKELQEAMHVLEETMGAMYSEDSFKQHAYRLHAVLVHEGQAASGHYWAFVYCPKLDVWWKYNDVSVTKAAWEEVERESVGAFQTASAYCLMYVDDSDKTLFYDGDGLETPLPADLQVFVSEDDLKFLLELAEWDEEVERRALAQAAATSTNTSAAHTPHAAEHAALVSQDTQAALRACDSCVSSDVFQQLVSNEMKRLDALAKTVKTVTPHQDPRLSHLVVYQKVNGVTSLPMMQRAVVEQFSLCPLPDTKNSIQQVLKEAKKEENNLLKATSEESASEYKQWHADYHEFRRMTLVFLAGVEQFHNERFASSLPYLVYACDLNDALTKDDQPMKGLDAKLLSYYRRQCFLYVNEVAAWQFERKETLTETLDLMERLILPSVTLLSSTSYQDDKSAVDNVRERWCIFLGQEVTNEKMEKLQDLLAKLFDSPSKVKTMYPSTIKRVTDKHDLGARYQAIMKLSTNSGYIDSAAGSK